jgi:hypothetical protein
MLQQLLGNQIAMALILFAILGIGAYIRLDSGGIKEVVIQLITATSALVTGVAIGSARRSTDKPTDTGEKSV